MSEQEAAPKQEKKEEEVNSLADMLKQCQGAPSEEQIEQWKTQFNEVFASGFSEEEMFVWRPISRQEWINLQTYATEQGFTQYKLEETVCEMCVLWRSTTHPWHEGKAGTASTLYEQVLQNSNFCSPQAASMLVAKL
jgi:hypothetical protein